MKATSWIMCVLGVCLTGVGIVAGTSYEMDIFGLFRDSTGKHLHVQHNERTGKFFLNVRYVPSNFDSLLIGGSSTSNWPMKELTFGHFYNESIYGSNYVEEKALVEEAMRRRHFRYAICLVNPYQMASHDFHEGSGPPPMLEALGSVNVLREEFYLAWGRARHADSTFWPDGGEQMPASTGHEDPYTTYTFAYDPVALDALQRTLDELRAAGTRIIFLRTGVYEPIYQRHKAELDRFYAAFPLRKEGEPLVDFNAPEYAAFRSDASRWVDPPHLNDASALLAAAELNRILHDMIPDLPNQ